MPDIGISGVAVGIAAAISNDDNFDPARGVLIAVAGLLCLKELLYQPRSLVTVGVATVSSGLLISLFTERDQTNLISDAFALGQIISFGKIAWERWNFYEDLKEMPMPRLGLALHNPTTALPFNALFHVLSQLSKVASTIINAAFGNAVDANLPKLPPKGFWISIYTALGSVSLWLIVDYYKLEKTIESRSVDQLNSRIHKATQFFLS